MKTVLCYGDSNTYGYNPEDMTRYPKDARWTTILDGLLPAKYEVIPEGLNGRTTAFDREGDDIKNGLRHLVPILHSHRPLDIVIFMLGTNDCNTEVDAKAKDIAEGMEKLIMKTREASLAKQSYLPVIIVVAPAHISSSCKEGPFAYEFDDDSISKSIALSDEYRKLCKRHGCVFADGGDIEVSDIDGIHLSRQGHKQLAHLLAETVLSIG
ncbi:MAG: SGNH/GDSL hydrolase family protein [Erysipelotrichaceae bacterium]|nr:SGNH/GDSL hydrolase family protein [Erysipelotrichaceae bacterium]